MTWRRLDLGFGLGVWVDGGGAGAMKRCGEGFCGGILGETWVFEVVCFRMLGGWRWKALWKWACGCGGVEVLGTAWGNGKGRR